MADFASMDGKEKSFWQKPEGVTGLIFLVAMLAALGFAGFWLLANIGTVAAVVASALVLGVVLFTAVSKSGRNLVSYMYKSAMRKITGLFITIDPIGILKNYLSDLEDNLRKMSKQIGSIRGQMRKLKTLVETNEKEIKNNMALASAAKAKGNTTQLTLSSRKAARLKESNSKYTTLLNKMQVIYRILTKMYTNSEILLEDTKDQVKVKEQERKAIRASHGAMKSAMSVISGDPDKRAMFDAAMEAVADDVSNKVGEMERMMEMSSSFMESIDLQNGVFEEKGLAMLEEWEKKSTLLLMENSGESLDLEEKVKRPELRDNSASGDNTYDNLFD